MHCLNGFIKGLEEFTQPSIRQLLQQVDYQVQIRIFKTFQSEEKRVEKFAEHLELKKKDINLCLKWDH